MISQFQDFNENKKEKITNISKYKKVWFTSDTHFDDERLNLFGRDILFNNAKEVDDFIIDEWNKKIDKKDLLIHVGDVALTKKGLEKIKELNGDKWLIKGNYDEASSSKFKLDDELLLKYFKKVTTDITIEIAGEEVYVNHYPTNVKVDCFNIVGHIHGTWKVQRNMINVGTDAWHFNPVSLDTIKFQMNGIRKYYDQNVFAGELKSNLEHIHGEVRVLRPPKYDIIDNDNDIHIFLAGPIQGADNWQEKVISKIEKEFKDVDLERNIVIASPRWLKRSDDFVYNDQVNWESYYLDKASLSGVNVFWLPRADTKQANDKGRSYAQTTRFELGEWFGKYMIDFVIGVEKGFHGEKYINLKFQQGYDYKISSNLNDVIKELISKIKEIL